MIEGVFRLSKLRKIKLLFISALATVLSVHAISIAEVLESSLRPTINEIRKMHPNYKPEEGIPYSGSKLNYSHFRDALRLGAAQFIVKLESAYPGATFAFLGRDTQTISDIVEAFYLSIGEENRVVRIGVSSPTLAELSNEQIVTYLEYFGFNLKNVNENRPFILIDTVSKGAENDQGILVSGRQGRRLIQAVYEAWVSDPKNNPKDILKYFNMIGLQVSTFDTSNIHNQARYGPLSDLKKIYDTNKQLLINQTAETRSFGDNLVIPLIPDTRELFNESGYDHYTGAWHNKFGPPIVDGKRLLPNTGSLTHPTIRNSILWLQHQIIDIVKDPNFKREVENYAKKNNVRFNISCKAIFGLDDL